MRVYLGQSRGNGRMALRIRALGFGEATQPYEYPPRQRPWFLDNGAYGDWLAGRDFDGAAFLVVLISAVASGDPPDFVVCPDRVATGRASLQFSLDWLARCESELRARSLPSPRWYFVVQDGMTVVDVRAVMHLFAGIFVGGTTEWKIETGAAWVRFAHEMGKPCHIGRAGTQDHACWALRIGADSSDSSLPLRADANWHRFMRGLARERPQNEMPWGPTTDDSHVAQEVPQAEPGQLEAGARRRSRKRDRRVEQGRAPQESLGLGMGEGHPRAVRRPSRRR